MKAARKAFEAVEKSGDARAYVRKVLDDGRRVAGARRLASKVEPGAFDFGNPRQG